MRKSKALTVRRTSLSRTNPATLIGILIIGLLLWFILKNKKTAVQYLNGESWDITYNADGLPTKIAIHRNAVRR